MGILFSTSRSPIYILLLLSISNQEYAQSLSLKGCIDPFAINVAGHSWTNTNFIIDWSVGEAPMIHTLFKHPLFLLSTGFLQSRYDPLLLYHGLDSFDIQIKVGPNPFNNHIYIKCNQDGIIITSIQLINFSGVSIYQLTGIYAGINYCHEIQIQKPNNSICYLYLHYTIADKIQKTKVIKLIQN